MLEPIRLDESRIVNGWIKTTEDGYVSIKKVMRFSIREEEEAPGERYICIEAFTPEGAWSNRAEVGYYPINVKPTDKNYKSIRDATEKTAQSDLDKFIQLPEVNSQK